MPVSLNGKLPTDEFWKPEWEKKYWHDGFIARSGIQRHAQRQWKPSDYFSNKDEIELCKAIFRSDLPKMKQLIQQGVDVNAKGKGGMNPLYWAFHLDTDPRPFEMLIEHGADPNVVVKYIKGQQVFTVQYGYSVTHLTAQQRYNRHFKTVFENGGDPNLIDEYAFGKKPAYRYLWPDAPDIEERVKLLIKHGARLDDRNSDGISFVALNLLNGDEKRCPLSLLALKAGADYKLYYKRNGQFGIEKDRLKGCYFRLIHFLALAEPRVLKRPKEQQKNYRKVVNWLEQRGESLDQAKADLARWQKWIDAGKSDLIEKEHQERLEKEKAANKG